MSMQSHLVELEKRHQAIEKEIETELHHSSSDDLRITALKRKKLKLKETIAKLQAGEPPHSVH